MPGAPHRGDGGDDDLRVVFPSGSDDGGKGDFDGLERDAVEEEGEDDAGVAVGVAEGDGREVRDRRGEGHRSDEAVGIGGDLLGGEADGAGFAFVAGGQLEVGDAFGDGAELGEAGFFHGQDGLLIAPALEGGEGDLEGAALGGNGADGLG